MNELKIIESRPFGEVKCDFYSDGKEPWMTRDQIGAALEYSNPRVAIAKIHARKKARLDKYSVVTKLVSPDGKTYDTIVYNRKGVMEICRHSDQPRADAFMDFCWDIMDSLMCGDTKLVVLPKDYPSALRALADQAEQNLALAAENEAQRQIIADYEPKVQYVDKILRSKGTLAVSQIAADYDMTPQELNKILHEEHVQHKVNGQWILYREHMGMGYTRSVPIDITHRDGRPDTISHTQWTQKGRLFIHDKLTKRGIVAVIDRKLAGEQIAI